MEVLDAQNWTRWRVWPSANFWARGGGGSCSKTVETTPYARQTLRSKARSQMHFLSHKVRSLRSLTLHDVGEGLHGGEGRLLVTEGALVGRPG